MELKNPSDAFAFMEKYEDEFSMQGNTSVLRWMGVSGNASFEGMLNGMLTILIVIIGVGAVSLIYNAFSISLRERTTQFGLLSSIGATKRQLRRSMWQEALVVGAIGIPIGNSLRNRRNRSYSVLYRRFHGSIYPWYAERKDDIADIAGSHFVIGSDSVFDHLHFRLDSCGKN